MWGYHQPQAPASLVVDGVTTAAINRMHQAVREALFADDSLPEEAPRPYGVREFNDWRT